MKKTHSANIGGTVFQVEEDAYDVLQTYLQSIETHFHSYPDVADIIADIEGRIAEQLMQREMAPQVVRMSDVERVIAAMGRTEQFADSEAPESQAGNVRKLFRDPDQKIIAGVATGLASYLGVPALLVRLLFLLLLFPFGASIIVYLLVWALVPVAASTTDKLQMRGRPLTLNSIDQGVRDSIASIPHATRSMAMQGVTAVGSLIHLVVITIARGIKWAAGVFVVGGAALGVLFLTVTLVVALVYAGAPPLPPDAAEFFANFGKWQHTFKVGVYLAAAIPLVAIMVTGLKLFWGVSRLNASGLTALLGVWVISLLATAAIWSGSYPQLREYWDEYPAMAHARESLDRFDMLAATTSPLSEVQSEALLATLRVEYKRRNEEPKYRDTHWRNLRAFPEYEQALLQHEEEVIKTSVESDARIVESARRYLDEQQLAVMQGTMTQDAMRMNTNLQARRDRLEKRLENSRM